MFEFCGLCIKHVFYSNALLSGALLTLNGPPRASQFLEIVNNLPVNPPFIYKPTDPESTPLTTSSIRFWYSGPLSISLDHSRAIYWTDDQGNPLCPRAYWNYSNQPSLNLHTLSHLFHPTEMIIKALAQIFASFPLLPDGTFLCPPLWKLWITNYLSNGNHLLICCPHPTQIIIKPVFYYFI